MDGKSILKPVAVVDSSSSVHVAPLSSIDVCLPRVHSWCCLHCRWLWACHIVLCSCGGQVMCSAGDTFDTHSSSSFELRQHVTMLQL